MTSHIGFLSTALRKPSRNTTTGNVSAEMATVKGPLHVRGATTLEGAVALGGATTLSGATTFTDTVTINDDTANLVINEADGVTEQTRISATNQETTIDGANKLILKASRPGFSPFVESKIDIQGNMYLESGQGANGAGYSIYLTGHSQKAGTFGTPGHIYLQAGDAPTFGGGGSIFLKPGAGNLVSPGHIFIAPDNCGANIVIQQGGATTTVNVGSTAPGSAIAPDCDIKDICGTVIASPTGAGETTIIDFATQYGTYNPVVLISSSDSGATATASFSQLTITYSGAGAGVITHYFVLGNA